MSFPCFDDAVQAFHLAHDTISVGHCAARAICMSLPPPGNEVQGFSGTIVAAAGFPFGHGLSYTSFELLGFNLSPHAGCVHDCRFF